MSHQGFGYEPQGFGYEPQGVGYEPQGFGYEPQGFGYALTRVHAQAAPSAYMYVSAIECSTIKCTNRASYWST